MQTVTNNYKQHTETENVSQGKKRKTGGRETKQRMQKQTHTNTYTNRHTQRQKQDKGPNTCNRKPN